ncbi:DUF305 domain-containing protein [Serinicoccus chungangensis]|uniref:DUF305 domain-containing protein n=1 Tax=Serinicoccus chungangensis TaxID=767452 RepID=A0A0W8I7N9_9MICO|nr:DUF305 domain-containing protein [Serinicoccus chungangensis]KUG54788.1 DUF305 domain-containing protein [Serinicoccus chungangensis]
MNRATRTKSMPTMALAALFTISACTADTGQGPATTVASEEHNDADVQFATEMIPHHQQAVEMSDMALRQGGPDVMELAERIQEAQAPEIETMTGWLQAWGEDVPETGDHGGMGDMDHSQMEGMMTPEDMEDLDSAEGSQFDSMWLEMMIEHHNGAITMAQTQVDDGLNPEAIALAEDIAESQEAEIDEMETLLQGATG